MTGDGAFYWTSRPARLKLTRLLKYRNNDSVQVRIKWRHGLCFNTSGTKFVPMHTLRNQLVTKESLKETFILRVHFSNGGMEERSDWQSISDGACEQFHQPERLSPDTEQEDAEGTVHEVCRVEEMQTKENSEGEEEFNEANYDIKNAEQKGKYEQKEKTNATLQEGDLQAAVGTIHKATARHVLSTVLVVLVIVVMWEVLMCVLQPLG